MASDRKRVRREQVKHEEDGVSPEQEATCSARGAHGRVGDEMSGGSVASVEVAGRGARRAGEGRLASGGQGRRGEAGRRREVGSRGGKQEARVVRRAGTSRRRAGPSRADHG